MSTLNVMGLNWFVFEVLYQTSAHFNLLLVPWKVFFFFFFTAWPSNRATANTIQWALLPVYLKMADSVHILSLQQTPNPVLTKPTDMIYSEEISDKHNCYASSQAVLIWLRSKSHRLWCSYSVTLAAWQLYIWQDSNTDKMIIENTLAAHGVFCQWWKEKWCSAFVQFMPGFVWQSLFHISQRQCLGFDFHFSQPIDLLTVFEVLDV